MTSLDSFFFVLFVLWACFSLSRISGRLDRIAASLETLVALAGKVRR